MLFSPLSVNCIAKTQQGGPLSEAGTSAILLCSESLNADHMANNCKVLKKYAKCWIPDEQKEAWICLYITVSGLLAQTWRDSVRVCVSAEPKTKISQI